MKNYTSAVKENSVVRVLNILILEQLGFLKYAYRLT